MKKEVDALRVGDRMRFSTELIEEFRKDGDRTQIVEVVKIEQMEDGLKVVYLKNLRLTN